jgi:hypothetical protein
MSKFVIENHYIYKLKLHSISNTLQNETYCTLTKTMIMSKHEFLCSVEQLGSKLQVIKLNLLAFK